LASLSENRPRPGELAFGRVAPGCSITLVVERLARRFVLKHKPLKRGKETRRYARQGSIHGALAARWTVSEAIGDGHLVRSRLNQLTWRAPSGVADATKEYVTKT
jgi:hypothetical protein